MMENFSKQIGQDILAFTNMFDFIKDLVFLMEVDEDSFRYLYINQSALKILHMNDNLLGSRIEDIVSHERSEVIIEKYRRVQITREPLEYIEKLETENGVFFGETSLNPILTEDGNCKYILAIVRDITERKNKERELKENQKRFSSIIEHNSDAVFEFDLEGNFVSINERATEIAGYKEAEFIGRSFIPMIVEEYLEDTIRYFEKALNGSNEEYETSIYHKNGNKVQLLVKNVPIIVDGDLVGIYGIAKDITEQKEIERLLQESEQRYKSLFENHPDGIFTYDIEGNFISGNAAVEKISGYSMDDLVGKSFVPMMVQEDVEKTIYHFNKAIKEKETERYEVALWHKDGHRVELFVMSIPIIVNDEVVGIYGLAKDITAEKRMKEEIREKTDELEAYWNNAVDPIFRLNTKGEILQFNPAFEKLFKFQEEDLRGSNDNIIPPEIVDEAREIDQKITNGETVTLYETTRKTKSGNILDILASYIPVRDKAGEIVGAYAFYKNVTELKMAERELQKSQEKYRLITENAFDIIKLINPSGIVEYVSPSNEEILGYPCSEYVGQSYLTYIHKDDIPILEERFRLLVDGNKSSTVEIRVRHKNGHYIWIEASTTPIIEDGKVQQLVTVARDITERKRLRDELEKAAFYDYLSGLPNRRIFDDRLQVALHQANRSKMKVAVMMLDGSKFKHINDTYGHDAGDAVIVEMAKRLQSCVRESDTVARMGGDEMAIILPELNSVEEAIDIAQRIIHSFEAPISYHDVEIKMGAGIGIALYPDHSIDKKTLVTMADEALYKAKESDQSDYKIYKSSSK